MNEWFKKFFATIKEKWGKWTAVQKGIAIGIILAVIVAVVLLITLSSRKTTVRLFNAPVSDETRRSQILDYLSGENVDAYATSEGYIYVNDAKTAEKYSNQLIVEGLAPTDIDPYALWKTDKFSIDDFQQNRVNWKQTIELQLTKRLQGLSGIRRADVTLAIPEETLLLSNQNPTTASVTLFPAYGSDALENKKIVKGIQSLILRSVEGLREENITIINGDTMETINDFEGMAAAEKVDITKKQQQLIKNLEAQYSTQILNQLVGVYSKERVNIANIKIDMDQSDVTEHSKEYSGITIKPDNLDTPYDDSEVVDHLTISSERIDKKYEATGYNPEGPAGMEGRNPDVYQDSSNMVGLSTESSVKENNALNEKITDREVAPSIDRVTVSVIIDGSWRKVYRNGKLSWDPDTGIEYAYTPISEEDLEKTRNAVRNAVGYDKNRGDQVTVENIPFDHTAEREAENEEYRRQQATRKTVMYVLISVVAVLVLFILYRVISREVERRRRLREEEQLRKQQQEREAALWDAKNEGMEVTMSVEERKRAELQENAIAMAKEHPEDVAMLIRTWLMEE